MAKLNLYVPDDLKARMDEVGDRVNWSEVARPALQSALAAEEHRRNANMTTAIERLRASKQETLQNEQANGKQAGREWAEKYASYDDLRRISKIEFAQGVDAGRIEDEAMGCLTEALDWTDDDIAEQLGDEGVMVTNEYAAAWIEGVQEFFAEVKDQL
jgi:hypothetical protein